MRFKRSNEDSHATHFKSSKLTASGTKIRLVRPDVAVVQATLEVTRAVDPDGKRTATRSAMMLMVFEERTKAGESLPFRRPR